MKRRLGVLFGVLVVIGALSVGFALLRRPGETSRGVLLRFATNEAIASITTPELSLVKREGPLREHCREVCALDGRSEWRYFGIANELSEGSREPKDYAPPGVSYDSLRRQLGIPVLHLPPQVGCAFALPRVGSAPLLIEAAGSFEAAGHLTLSVVFLGDDHPELVPRLPLGALRARFGKGRIATALVPPLGDEVNAQAIVYPPPGTRSVLLLATANGDRFERVAAVKVFELPPLAQYVATNAISDHFVANVELGAIASPCLVVPTGGVLSTVEFAVPPDAVLALRVASHRSSGVAPKARIEVVDGGTRTRLYDDAPPPADSSAALVRIDLLAQAGRRVHLEFEAELGDSDVAVASDPSLVFFCEPVLMGSHDGARGGWTRFAPAPDIVLLCLDGLRADRLGSAGNKAGLTPNIDWLAQRGTRFSHAYANAPWTLPSHATLFSSLLPATHGVEDTTRCVGGDVPLVTTTIAKHGYRTAAFTGGGTVSEAFGFARGFDRFCEVDPIGDRGSAGIGVTNGRFPDGTTGSLSRAFDFLDEEPTAPAFLFLHTLMAQGFLPPKPLAERFKIAPGAVSEADPARLRIAYDATVMAADQMVGDVVRRLIDRGTFDRTLVVVLADHGQELFEHGRFGHGETLYDESLRVPLIVKAPFQTAGVVVDTAVSLVDVAPTILDLAGLPPMPDAQGVLLGGVERESAKELPFRPILARVHDPQRGLSDAVIASGFEYVESASPSPPSSSPSSFGSRIDREAYDLLTDPGERTNEIAAESARSTRFKTFLDSTLRDCAALRQRLRLGETLLPQDAISKMSPRLRALSDVVPRTRK